MAKSQLRKPKDTAIRQQRAPGWFPIMTPKKVIIWMSILTAYVVLVMFMQMISNLCLFYHEERYTYSSSSPVVSVNFQVTRTLKAPVFIHYRISGFYQNHATFVKNENDYTSEYCFNDTFALLDSNKNAVPVDTQNIITTFDHKRPSFTGMSRAQMVWHKIAPYPTFHKLYGKITSSLEKGYYTLEIGNNYKAPGHTLKSVIVDTSGFLGQKSWPRFFLYFAVALGLGILTLVAVLIQCLCPRRAREYHNYFGSDVADSAMVHPTKSGSTLRLSPEMLKTSTFVSIEPTTAPHQRGIEHTTING